MSAASVFAAVDLGASSGRVMRGTVLPGRAVQLVEAHRFTNVPVSVNGTLHWDVLALWAGVLAGMRTAAAGDALAGVAVDGWGVDYALLDEDGALLGNPVHYRDARTDGMPERVDRVVPLAQLYATTGVQIMPFNTVFQWAAARESWAMQHAVHALLIPDLFGYWLTGRVGAELTNASTTGLLDVRTRNWADSLCERLGLRRALLPAIRPPGEPIGLMRDDVAEACGLAPTRVLAVGSHDTASAVVAVPARDDRFAYISSGTWSLVGVELSQPVTSEAARTANFSNELGVDGTVRFLRNVMGLWLLQESLRSWQRAGLTIDRERLLAEAAALPARQYVVDPDRAEFFHPGDMPGRIQAECRRTGQAVPQTPAQVARCVLDSLAGAYARTVRAAAELSGHPVSVVHVVGGGARNALLCQLTADACGLPVVAGPAEAAAYGNVLVQARAVGAASGGLAELRQLLPTDEVITYVPRAVGVPHQTAP